MPRACGQDVGFDGADEDRVRRLLGDEPLELSVVGDPLRLDDVTGGEGGRADAAHLALVHEVAERRQRFLDVRARIDAVHLVEVDPVGAQAPSQIFIGYIVGAAVMIVGGLIQAAMGVEAAGRDLEDIAPPLSAAGEEIEEPGEQADPYTLAPEEGRHAGTAAGSEWGSGSASPRFEREDASDPVTRTRPTGGQP